MRHSTRELPPSCPAGSRIRTNCFFSRVVQTGVQLGLPKKGVLVVTHGLGSGRDTGQLRFVVQMPVYGLPDGLDGHGSGWNAGGGRQGT